MNYLKNPYVVFRENRLNKFTCAIVERFEKSGKKHVLVEILNGAIFKVVVRYADQDYVDVNDDTELGSVVGFRTEDHQHYWGLNGYSRKNNDYDLYSLVS